MMLCSKRNIGFSNKILCQLTSKNVVKNGSQTTAFIQAENWTTGGPGLNPLDYELQDILEQNACQKLYPNLESLKQSIIEEPAKISLEMICKSVAKWPDC